MFLKELNLVGFKSFARPVRLEMAPGVTAIVGPNGSGKSNIVDGVRWVLGEQSARALRGSHGEDVIFGGSTARHPLGMAEVSLVLDNADGRVAIDLAEVAITRRVHRSGETEYLLNRRRARLRDVLDVAGQAGLGPDSYCVVGQGTIEQLATQRPQERRSLIADAADIRRHEARLAQVESDLLEVQRNALRMTAVVAEIRPQLDRLRVQAERAGRHQRVRDELYEAARAWYGRASAGAQANAVLAEQNLLPLANAIAGCSSSLAEQESMRRQQQEKIHQLRARAASREEALAPARANAERLRLRQVGLGERLAALEARQSSIRTERLADEQTLLLLREAANQSLEALARVDQEPEHLRPDESGTAYAAAEARVASLRRSLGVVRQAAEDSAREAARWEREVARLQAELLARASAASDAQRRESEARARTTQLQVSLESAVAEEAVAVEHHRAVGAAAAEIKREVEAASKTLRELDATQKRAQQLVDTLRGEERALTALQHSPSALPEHERLSGHLRARSGYERAIAAALGEASRYRVVDVADNTWLEEPSPGAERVAVPAHRATAADGLDFEARIRRVLDRQFEYDLATAILEPGTDAALGDRYLGDLVVVPTLAAAIAVAQSLSKDDAGLEFRVASKDGHCLTSHGEHAFRPEEREAQAIDLRERRAELGGRIATAQEQLKVAEENTSQAHAADEAGRARLRSAEEELRAAATEVSRAHESLRQLRVQLNRSQDLLKGTQPLPFESDQELSVAADAKLSAATAKHQAALLKIEECERELNVALEDRQTAGERRARREAERSTIMEHIARLRDAAARDERELHSLEARLGAMDRSEKQIADERTALIEQAAIIAAEGDGAVTRVTSLEAEHHALSEEGAFAEMEAEQTTSLVDEQHSRLADLRASQAEHQRDLERARAVIERLTLELTVIAETLHCTPVELTAGSSVIDLAEPLDPALERRLNRAQREMRSIGGVDYGVLAEYAALRDRDEHLTGQLDDLGQTETAIRAAMAEARGRMDEQFTRALEDVNTRFSEMFRVLFGGGDAELILVGEASSAQCGIDIVAQPPGKRLNRLATLSGGERALIGGALLLALIGANPSPFCMLDEVDAALDESNVQRFASMLRDMATQTQFIVVTHNRATMEIADALYGVTMASGAVSQVLAMKLPAEVS